MAETRTKVMWKATRPAWSGEDRIMHPLTESRDKCVRAIESSMTGGNVVRVEITETVELTRRIMGDGRVVVSELDATKRKSGSYD